MIWKSRNNKIDLKYYDIQIKTFQRQYILFNVAFCYKQGVLSYRLPRQVSKVIVLEVVVPAAKNVCYSCSYQNPFYVKLLGYFFFKLRNYNFDTAPGVL